MFEAVIFIGWTFLLYVLHFLVHYFPPIGIFHQDHHRQVYLGKVGKWSYKNLFLWNDTWKSTVDTWTIEVIPTIIYCWYFNSFWILLFYYLWTATIRELIEHNPQIDVYPFDVSGKWHMGHHYNPNKNYGILHPWWDVIFKTARRY